MGGPEGGEGPLQGMELEALWVGVEAPFLGAGAGHCLAHLWVLRHSPELGLQCPFTYLIRSFHEYLFSTYYVPGIKDTAVIKTENPPLSRCLPCGGGVREPVLNASSSTHTRGDQGYGNGVITHPRE